MITLVRILIILGLGLDVMGIWFAIKKFTVLENILLIHWTKLATAISLAILGFWVGFVSKFFELFLPRVYEGLLEQSLNTAELALTVCGLTIMMYTWMRARQS